MRYAHTPVKLLVDVEVSGDAIATLRAAHEINERPEPYMLHRITTRLGM